MDSLEFECPLCNGLLNAAPMDVEVTCPHCDGKTCLGSFHSTSSTNVILTAKPITAPAPIFPPGYKDPAASDSSAPPVTVPDESLREKSRPVVIIDDDADESLVGTDTDTAIDDLLPPGFQLDDVAIEMDTDLHETTGTTGATGAKVVIDVQVDGEPITVGQGINERELRSRTPDEKNQFIRKKNVIVWGIGVLIIIVTMVIMLQLA
jgi:hypothetical protein